ncbi:hypothetical protein HME9304_02023 [Flagellimonas maritima]|uniref:Erythromycin esterase family protein n=2 Tax=Flagellimonas maritima TaxID=1383885 RepID=A0A2Z4LSY0_9FLAO|nr:hypothetical protein HME9304_02023 [Allomuricauda aurantiaca]
MKYLMIFFLMIPLFLTAQKELHLAENSFQVDSFTERTFEDFVEKVIPESQFIFIGEQHGIQEAGIFTNIIFNWVNPLGFETLCIETDAILAEKLAYIASLERPLEAAKKLNDTFPYAIPFYNSKEDYSLFKNVVDRGGHIWGIDQTFMAQFRLNLDHLIQNTDNVLFKERLLPIKKLAFDSYAQSIAKKSFESMFWTTYDLATHEELMALSTNNEEKDILYHLWKTKEIYGYNAKKEYYQNNNERGKLMKANFTKYYMEALKKTELPRVVFKLGASHATRGLSMTNIYDVSNYASELAIFNHQKSLHFFVAGITGEAMTGNPFAEKPVAAFDNTKRLPKELQVLVSSFSKKYTIVHLAPLRKYAYGETYSEAMKKYIFNFDVMVLVKNAEPLSPL